MNSEEYGHALAEQERRRKKFLQTKKSRCAEGCGRTLIIPRDEKKKVCGVCKTIEPQKSKEEWLRLNTKSPNTKIGAEIDQ